jgi:phosphatidylinositol-3-phosphatase
VTRRGFSILAVALLAAVVVLRAAPARADATSIKHVYVIVLENESASTTFAPGSPAPYLASQLTAQGAFVPNYYGIGHNSNDNYIAMISGQAPNTANQEDCQTFSDFVAPSTAADGQENGLGCVYPASIPTIASQLSGAGLTWRDYNEDMGADPSREAGVCAHPAVGSVDNTQTATAADQYATRHNPFVYFHSIIDNTTLCDENVVNLSLLPQDLASASATPNYAFITPDLCNDGHDAPCKNGDPGGLAQADKFLQTWVPQVTNSPAFRQDGLLMVIFDEAATSDTSACCGEIPGPGTSSPGLNGPGGGRVGAVLLSPCIAPGTVTQTAYNHYSMLRSVEDIFGLSHIGYAQLPGETSFGSDVFNRPCGPAPPVAGVMTPALLSSVSSKARVPLKFSATTTGGTPLASFAVQVRDTSAAHPTWRTLRKSTTRTSLTFVGSLGHTYSFQVIATNTAGQTSTPVTATTVIPSGVRPAKGKYSRGWSSRRVPEAWQGKAMVSTTAGSTFTLRYRGGSLALIGERTSGGGRVRVTLDGRSHTIRLHSSRRRVRQVVFSEKLRSRTHRLTVRVLSGTVALEGVAISSRRG